jgi:hypothetical protein
VLKAIEKSAVAKSAASSSSLHSRSRSNQPARSNLPTIQEEAGQNNPEQLRANGVKDGDLRTNLDKNRHACDTRGYIDQRHHERDERELRHHAEYVCEYVPLVSSTASWNARSATAMKPRIGVALSTKQTTAIWRRAPGIQIVNPGPRSSPLRRVEVVLKMEMALTT